MCASVFVLCCFVLFSLLYFYNYLVYVFVCFSFIARKIDPKNTAFWKSYRGQFWPEQKTTQKPNWGNPISENKVSRWLSKCLVYVRGMSCLLFAVELVAVGSLTVRRPCVETGVPQGGVLCILAVVGSHAHTSRYFQTIFSTPNKCLVDLLSLAGRYLLSECTWP